MEEAPHKPGDRNKLSERRHFESESSDDDDDLVDAGGLSTDQCNAIGSGDLHIGTQDESEKLPNPQSAKRGIDSSCSQPYRTIEFATHKQSESTHFSEQDVRDQKTMLREIRRQNKMNRIELHKFHLLCLVSSLRIRNNLCNAAVVRGVALSIVPNALHASDISVLLLWFRATFMLIPQASISSYDIFEVDGDNSSQDDIIIVDDDDNGGCNSSQDDIIIVDDDDNGGCKQDAIDVDTSISAKHIVDSSTSIEKAELLNVLQTRRGCALHLVEVWVTICRTLGYNVRVAWSLNPLPQQNQRSDDTCAQRLTSNRRKRRRVSENRSKQSLTSASCDNETPHTLDQLERGNFPCIDSFSEVHINNEWITIDCIAGCVNQSLQVEARLSREATYIVVVDNTGTVRDVTPRYARRWLTTTASHRCAPSWWESFLGALDKDTTRKSASIEDLQLDRAVQAAADIPQSLTALKSHRLYVLKRHLRHDQALHPSAAAVGMAKSEPVYLRSHINSVKSRDAWFKDARVVLPSALPVKTRARRASVASHAAVARTADEPVTVDLYGQWQTEEYTPPTARNGIVPRNSYGNVDLFQLSMMPRGCVLVDDPTAQKVAQELGIDNARGVVGFEHRMGAAVPLLSKGCIICEEFEEVLMAAVANRRQFDTEQSAKKRVDQVHRRWCRLVRAALIRLSVAQHWED